MEIIFAFRPVSTGQGAAVGSSFAAPDAALVRRVLVALGQRDIELEPLQYRVDDAMRPAMLVRIALSEWPPPAVREETIAAIRREWGVTILRPRGRAIASSCAPPPRSIPLASTPSSPLS